MSTDRRYWLERLRKSALILPAVGVVALLQRAGLLADCSLWLVGGTAWGAHMLAEVFVARFRDDGPEWQLWVRLAPQMLGVTALSYLLGWGPAFSVAYVAVALANIRRCGSRAVRPALVCSFIGLGLGQAGIAVGLFPTLIEEPLVHGLAILSAAALVPTMMLLGWSTARREASEQTATRLLSLAENLSRRVTRAEVCQRVAEAASRLVGLDRATVLLWDPVADTLTPTGLYGHPPAAADRLHNLVLRPGETPLLAPVVANPAEPPIAEVAPGPGPEDDTWLRDAIAGSGAVEFFVVPISTGGQTLGLITAERHTGRPRGLTDAELARLGGVAAQAAIALENARLLEQERAALVRLQELDRLKSEFLAVVSHELRTPLSVMLGAARTLQWRAEELDAGLRDDLIGSVVRRGEELDRLVKDLLEASGDIQLEIGPVDLASIVRTAVTDVTTLHPDRRVVVDCPDEVVVRADALRVRQVVDNLLTNAAKYAPGSEVRIAAGVAGHEGWLSVTDDGPGMTDEQVDHAFDAFWQGDSSAIRRVGGLGLGLHITRRIVQAHGGRIWIDSTPGSGTRVTAALPVAGPTSAAQAHRSEPDGRRGANGRSEPPARSWR